MLFNYKSPLWMDSGPAYIKATKENGQQQALCSTPKQKKRSTYISAPTVIRCVHRAGLRNQCTSDSSTKDAKDTSSGRPWQRCRFRFGILLCCLLLLHFGRIVFGQRLIVFCLDRPVLLFEIPDQSLQLIHCFLVHILWHVVQHSLQIPLLLRCKVCPACDVEDQLANHSRDVYSGFGWASLSFVFARQLQF